jgi:hypothetical protein
MTLPPPIPAHAGRDHHGDRPQFILGRAGALVTYLIAHGVKPTIISANGFGDIPPHRGQTRVNSPLLSFSPHACQRGYRTTIR